MNYKRQGSGVAVVLLHGFCENLTIWDNITPTLNKTCEVITLDLPGFGGSRHLSAPTTLSEVAEKAHEFLQSIGVSEYVVVGHSLGGYLALELARQYSDAILGIGLIHSTAFADDEEKVNSRKKTIEFVQKRGVELFINSFVPQLFANKKHSNITTVVELAKRTPERSLINYTKAMMIRGNYLLTLKNWTKPLLFIAGTNDSIVPIDKSRKHLQYMSEACFFELPNVGHMGMYESPDEVTGLVGKLVWTISK